MSELAGESMSQRFTRGADSVPHASHDGSVLDVVGPASTLLSEVAVPSGDIVSSLEARIG
jgi:hypothetical protein